MSASVHQLRSSPAQTKVCVQAGCWAKGAPQPLEDFYPRRKGSPERQPRCKRCDNAGRLSRTRAELSSLGVSPRNAANEPPAPPVEDEQPELDAPEELGPETVLDRAWYFYEREERERTGIGHHPRWSPSLVDVDEAERFANEVLAELRAGVSIAVAIDRANADASKLGDEERPLDLFKSDPAIAPGQQRRTHGGESEGAVHDGHDGGEQLRGQRGDRGGDEGRAVTGRRSGEQHLEQMDAGRVDRSADHQPRRVRAVQAGRDVLRRLHSGAAEGGRREARGLSASKIREAAPSSPALKRAPPPPLIAVAEGAARAITNAPEPPPSGPRALIQTMTLDRFEGQHMGVRNGNGERIEDACSKRAKTIVELVQELGLEPKAVRNALDVRRRSGRMSCDDDGGWGVVDVTPGKAKVANGHAKVANGHAKPATLEQMVREKLTPKPKPRAIPASAYLGSFPPPPAGPESNAFRRDLLSVRERVIGQALERVSKLDVLLASLAE